MSKDARDDRWRLGLMTGTALDGAVDLALLRTDGERIFELGPWALEPYGEDLRALLAEAVAAARAWAFAGPEPEIFARAERAYTLAVADAIRSFLRREGLAAREVGLIGLHGLTVLHRAPGAGRAGATRQLGDGALLAREVGVDVAFDFRSADVAAGGNGAPLAPIYHAALMAFSGVEPPAAVLNLGGVANITWRGADGALVAFDTGPANGPINEWMEAHGLGAFDRDGALAARGRAHEDKIQAWLGHPYLSALPPKSLDRYDFSARLAEGMSAQDGAATLTAFSAACVARALDLLASRPKRLVVAGGGRKNPVLIGEIARRAQVAVVDAETLGWRGDAVEAECFAFLAERSRRGLPLSFPGTTGAPDPLTGGRIASR